MRRVAFVLQVNEERIDEYVEHHRHVWPEMQDALRRHGWHNYSLFLTEKGQLFGYFETPESLEAAVAGMAGEEVNARWQELMKPYFDHGDDAAADQMMCALPEIFHLD